MKNFRTVQVKALKSQLLLISKGISKKCLSLPIMETIKISFFQNVINFDITNLQNNNFQLSVSLIDTDCDACFLIGEILIDFKAFYQLIKTLDNKSNVSLAIDNNQLVIESENIKLSLQSFASVADYPLYDTDSRFLTFENFSIFADELKTAIDKVFYSMPKQDIRYYLNAAKFTIENRELSIVCSDGHRLALSDNIQVFTDMEKTSFVLPRESMIVLHEMLKRTSSGRVNFSLTRDYIEVTTNEHSLKAALFDVNYPDFYKVLEVETQENYFVTDKKYFLSILKTLEKTCNPEYKGLTIESENNQVFIDTGNVKTVIDASVTGNFKIGLNAVYLIDMVKNTIKDNVKIGFAEQDSFIRLNQENNLNIVMAMRL